MKTRLDEILNGRRSQNRVMLYQDIRGDWYRMPERIALAQVDGHIYPASGVWVGPMEALKREIGISGPIPAELLSDLILAAAEHGCKLVLKHA